jgi:hypothetical protein
LSRNETVKSGGTGILPVSAQHGQDGHATSSAAVFALIRTLGELHGFDLGQVLTQAAGEKLSGGWSARALPSRAD